MQPTPKTKTIFIVEDNAAYASVLKEFLKAKFPDVSEVKIFPLGEASLLELYQNPTVIIIDHLLDSVQSDAATGLSIIKIIKDTNPSANIILLSAQKEFDVVSETISKYGCKYVQKDEQAFNKVEQLVKDFLL
jgi:DNA-binding NarL/FixJ family response regulator